MKPPDPDDLAAVEAARIEAARQARRAASRTALTRARAALEAELVAPLVPTSPPHDLASIAAQRPKIVNDFNDAATRQEET